MTIALQALFCSPLAALAAVPAHAALNVVACEPEWASLAKELGGDKVKVSSTTTALQDPHHIEARPSLIARIRNADLLVCTGMELEVGWLPVLIQQSGNARLAAGRAGQLRGRPLRPAARGADARSTAARATSTPPAIRTSSSTRATSRRSRPRWRRGWRRSTPPTRRSTSSASRRSRRAGTRRCASGSSRRAAARHAGGRAPQEHELPVELARHARGRDAASPSRASSRAAAT